jgi:glycosyltransferase involved in cell wall biosynthesis
MHGHWVIPGGVMAALAARRLPLVISLHGSDVFIAERHVLAGRAARAVFRRASWVTAPSDDLRSRAEAIGADPARAETVPYGVDAARFAPSAETRAAVRRELGLGADTPLVFTAGRLVSKKGFEYLIDAARTLATGMPALRVAIAGDGDLRDALAARAGGAAQILWLGRQPQDRIGRLAAAADVIAVPSIRDEAGNVDGLPNFALEALASATPVVASTAGGLPQAIVDGVTGRLVPERDAAALAAAISELLGQPETARRMGAAARDAVTRNFGWARVAERFEAAYNRPGSPRED